MEVSIKVELDSKIIAELGLENGGRIHSFFTETCYKHMSPFVPGGTKSHINQNVFLDVDSITYLSPSAPYLYNGKLYVDPLYEKGAFFSPSFGFWSRPGITKKATNIDLKYSMPNTGAFWDKKMWSSKSEEVIKEVQSFIDKGSVK